LRLLGLNPALIARPEVAAIFSDRGTIAAMLQVEAALAQAEAECGVIPESATGPIAACCDASLYDLDAMAAGARQGGTVAIPVAKALGDLVRAADPAAASWVHFGATSQDIVDTALVLQLRQASQVLLADAGRIAAVLRDLVRQHAATPMLGRTLLQPGPPITFGLKAAGWLGAIERGSQRVADACRDMAQLQFGGAVGTLAALGDNGLAVSAAMGQALNLAVPSAPWHGHRDRLAAFSAAVTILGGTAGKIARDVSLMMQAELAEVAEPVAPGRGGSSTMPHKRNPVGCVTALAAANRLPGLLASVMAGMVVEHERGAGPWQAEAGLHAEICLATSGALHAILGVVDGLQVFPAAMARNIDALRGLILAERLMLALAPVLGRAKAHTLVEGLVGRCKDGGTLQDAAAAEPQVTAVLPDLAPIFDPAGYLGATPDFIARTLGDS
jgi:3-carboxy-cis,cis-muconate cycloisomerase